MTNIIYKFGIIKNAYYLHLLRMIMIRVIRILWNRCSFEVLFKVSGKVVVVCICKHPKNSLADMEK